jgi:hypothetical protein
MGKALAAFGIKLRHGTRLEIAGGWPLSIEELKKALVVGGKR